MTRKTKRTTDRSHKIDELDQLEMFREGGLDANDQGEHADDHYSDDFDDEAGDVNLAAMEEALQEAEHALDADIHHEPHGGKRIQRHKQKQRSEHDSGMNLLLLAGWLMLVPAGGLLMASLAAPAKMAVFLESLRTAGLTPTALVTIAVIVIGIAILRGRQANIELRVGDVEATLLDNDTGMSASLDYLVEAQEHHLDRPPASGEELERVLLVLQRQDEKVNNLTRAIKMYGKPLIEITKQMADVTARIEALRSSVGTIAETVDTSGLETALAGISESLQKQIGGELDKILSEVSKQDDDTLTKTLAELKQEMSQMASSVQRLQQSGVAGRPATQAPSGLAAPAAPAALSSGGASLQDPNYSGHAHSISGTRSSPGKGVLGSIAKLKKMRQ